MGAEKELDTMNNENDSEIKKVAEEWKLHRMDNFHNLLDLWQGSQNLCATQKGSCTQNMQMTTMGYISDTEEIVKASWSLFQPDGATAFKLSERSPLSPPLPAKDLHGGRTQLFNVWCIRRSNCHPVESNQDSSPQSISDTADWLNRNGDLDNPTDSEDDCVADIEAGIQQDNSIKDPDCPEQQEVCAEANVPGLIRPTPKSK